MKKKIFVTIIALLTLVALLVIGTGCKDPIKVTVEDSSSSCKCIIVKLTSYAPSGTVTITLNGGNTQYLNKNGSSSYTYTYLQPGLYTIKATASGMDDCTKNVVVD